MGANPSSLLTERETDGGVLFALVGGGRLSFARTGGNGDVKQSEVHPGAYCPRLHGDYSEAPYVAWPEQSRMYGQWAVDSVWLSYSHLTCASSFPSHPPSALTEGLREGCLLHVLSRARDAECAAADAHDGEELEGRDDGHREAPAASGLAAQPHPEEAVEGRVHECDDAVGARATTRRPSPATCGAAPPR